MNKKLVRAFVIASSITLIAELIESEFNFKLGGALLLSIPAFVVGILIDRYFNKKEFENKISEFILSLSEIRRLNNVNSKVIQQMMIHVTSDFAEIFDQKKLLKTSNTNDDKDIELPCFICGDKHRTGLEMRCENCKLSSEKWTYLNEKLKSIE